MTEFEERSIENVNNNDTEQLGYLIHEIGNLLAAASAAHQMVQQGRVGGAGNTSKVLSDCLEHMWHLISSAQMEIRMRGVVSVEQTQVRLLDIADEIETSARIKAKSIGVLLEFEVNPKIQLLVDRHLLFSAFSNLVNNAIKFTKKNGHVSVRVKESAKRILIEVEDECGGLPDGQMEELFKPFVQKGSNKTGMGLGLSISRRAIELNKGKLTVRNIPKKGCVFTINLPQ